MSGKDITIQNQLAEWLGRLDAMKEINFVLQRRLSEEIRRSEGNKSTLETLESYLDKFLNKDLHISLLRKDVVALQSASNEQFSLKQQRLQHEIERMKEELQTLQTAFNHHFCVPVCSSNPE